MGTDDRDQPASSTRAYRLGEHAPSVEPPRSSRVLGALARLREARGDSIESESLAARATRARSGEGRSPHGRCIAGRDALAVGALSVAALAYARWIDVASTVSTRDEDRVEALAAHAAICFVLGRPLAAESALREAVLAAQRTGQAPLPTDAPPAAALCLAATWRRLARGALAAAVIDRVTSTNAPPLLVGAVSHARAEAALATGAVDQALLHATEAAEVRAAVFGESHPAYAASLALVGRTLHRQRRLADAETALSRAIEIIQAHARRDAVLEGETLGVIAELLLDRGRSHEAIKLAALARDVVLGAAPGPYACVLPTLESCATVLRAVGNPLGLNQVSNEIVAIRATYFA